MWVDMIRDCLPAVSVGIIIGSSLLLSAVTVVRAAVDKELSAEHDVDASTDTLGRDVVVTSR